MVEKWKYVVLSVQSGKKQELENFPLHLVVVVVIVVWLINYALIIVKWHELIYIVT